MWPRKLWEKEARAHGADLDRVQVWIAFSELFLDTEQSEAELQQIGEIIADSPFSAEELAHILTHEVVPVCGPNLFVLPGGEWAGFDPDWLIEKSLKQQRKRLFKSSGNPAKVPLRLHLLRLGPTSDAYFLLQRVLRIRAGRAL